MITRRNFFKACLAGATLFPLDKIVASADIESNPSSPHFENMRKAAFLNEKILTMFNIHTGERLHIQYCLSGKYDHEALQKINYFLRCHYTNEVREIDIRLLDLLCDIKGTAGGNAEVQIISGYRSADYNEKLVRHGRNVSRNSLHLQGLAIDFAIEKVRSERLSQIARSFAAGGVGRYPEFVHIDVGRVRYW